MNLLNVLLSFVSQLSSSSTVEVCMELGKTEEACKQFHLAIELGLNSKILGDLLDKCK